MAKRAVDGVEPFFPPLSYPDRQGKTPPNINKKGNIEEASISKEGLAFSWLIMLQPVRSRKSADFLGDHRIPKGLVFDLFLFAWLLGGPPNIYIPTFPELDMISSGA